MADGRMLVVGYGTMAAAMVEGWLAAGLERQTLTIYNPRPKAVPPGVAFTTELPQHPFGQVLLAFKPHMLAEVAPTLTPTLDRNTLVLSVLAGIDLAQLARQLPAAGAHLRFMPNLAAAIGKSPNVLIGCGLTRAQREEATRLATMLGTAEWLEEEGQFDLATALAGSGPGFVYRFIDALAAGAEELGLAREQADRLALQMVEGAGALAASSGHPPAELAARVASKGGMTQAGLDMLDRGDALNRLVRDTLRAARDRGAELNRPAGDG